MKKQIKLYVASLVLLATGVTQAQVYMKPLTPMQKQEIALLKKGTTITDRKVQIFVDTNPGIQRLRVSIGGVLMQDKDGKTEWPISSGRQGHTTPTGTYSLDNRWKIAFSRKYKNSPMPFAQFYQGGLIGIHGTEAPQHLGHVASHGCIRLHTDNAMRLFSMVNATLLLDCQQKGVVSCPLTDKAFKDNPSQNVAVVIYNSNRPETLENVPLEWPSKDSQNPEVASDIMKAKQADASGDKFDSHDADDDKYQAEIQQRLNPSNPDNVKIDSF